MEIQVKITRKENMDFFGVPENTILSLDFEEYIAAVVASEIGNANLEACKAQAVAARTYAMRYRDTYITDDSSVHQAYRASRYDRMKYPNAAQAVQETRGEILKYNGQLAYTVFSASNGGTTVSAKTRWGKDYPYLIEQPDPWDHGQKTGHGVGLSQRGAIYAGLNGIGYEEILQFYYPSTTLCLIETEAPKILKELYNDLKEYKEKIDNIIEKT